MVVFTCNACGQSIKKNRVEKHWQTECPGCEVLSCMDCGKDFYGDEYAAHNSCITEAEKYQGACFKGEKGGQSKGERKQQEWLQRVRESMNESDHTPKISKLLDMIAEYPNIPRKKSKFENFVRNSINVRDQATVTALWTIFSKAATAPAATSGPEQVSEATPTTPPEETVKCSETSVLTNGESGHEVVNKTKKKKRSREEEVAVLHSDHEDSPVKKKKKKKHRQSELTVEELSSISEDEVPKKSKKKHKQRLEEEAGVITGKPVGNEECSHQNEEEVKAFKHSKKHKSKHNKS